MAQRKGITRRGFVMGCSAAMAALSGSRLNRIVLADPGEENQEIFVLLFCRGGLDGLSLVPPIGGVDRGHYESARPGLQIPTSGPGAALPLAGDFGLHSSAAPLLPLFQDGKLAIVQAVGMQTVVNRSHFDAMQYLELGTPGLINGSTGWLTRHLQSASNLPVGATFPSLAVGDIQPTSLLGNYETLNLDDPTSFNLNNAHWQWRGAQRVALREMYQGNTSWLHDAGVQSLDAMDLIELNNVEEYTPANGAIYPEGGFGDQLKILAQLIKLDLGISIATIDFGGWDTHEGQANSPTSGYLPDLFDELSRGLAAFYLDLDGTGSANYTQRLTVAVQSEFGRELFENNDDGTEHGYGNLMMVLSGNAIGGLHGDWPGLATGQLQDETDLAVTTDYRQVMSEILIRRLCNPTIYSIFPGYADYTPLGVVQGADLPPGGNSIFGDGFESGDTSAWSSTT